MKTNTLTRTAFGRVTLPLAPWFQLARERRQLAGLAPERLRDMGIDPVEARREAGRAFWDVPAGRI